jgi:hypothetical protein
LKAAGVGLGFDPSSVEVLMKSTLDIDDEKFYDLVITSDDKKDEENQNVLSNRKIEISVRVSPDQEENENGGGVLPNGFFGKEMFQCWIFFDERSMSVGAAVVAPAFLSKWSTQEKFLFSNDTTTNTELFEENLKILVREYSEKLKQNGNFIVQLQYRRIKKDEGRKFPHSNKTEGNDQEEEDEAKKARRCCCGCCFAQKMF